MASAHCTGCAEKLPHPKDLGARLGQAADRIRDASTAGTPRPQQYWSPSTACSLCLAYFNAKRRAQQPYRGHVTVLWRLRCLLKPRQLHKCLQAAACASINLG